MQFILSLGTMLAVAFLFTKIRGFIKNRVFNQLKKKFNGVVQLKEEGFAKSISKKEINALFYAPPIGFNASVGKSYKKGKEPFSWTKFKKIFDLGDRVEWIKSIKEIIDLRKLLVYISIVLICMGYSYWKGQQGKPINWKFNHKERIHLIIPEDARTFDKPANSSIAYWIDKKGNKTIVTVKDSKYISEKLKPYGFELEPFFSYGMAVGETKVKQDVGVGITWLRYNKFRIANWLSNNGLWIGLDYSVTKNFGILGGVGKGWAGDNLIGINGRFWFN